VTNSKPLIAYSEPSQHGNRRKGRTADWVKVGLQHPCGDFYFGEDPEAAPGVQAAMEEVKKCPTKSSSS
jgi:hypothetical protein